MARMIPETIDAATLSNAERVLYRELRSQLQSDDYTIFHSLRWLTRDRNRPIDGEADFVVVHPDLGFLVIEVKGGTITFDTERQRWFSESANGQISEIKDPFIQAETSMRLLHDKLMQSPETCGKTWPHHRLVAFPESLVKSLELPVHADAALVLDSSDLSFIVPAIRKAMEAHGKGGPGKEGIKEFIRLMRPSIVIRSNGMAAVMSNEREAFLHLTDQQMVVLEALHQQRQIVVEGVAGSGKTILAVERARRLAKDGYTVLFTCFNRALAHAVQEQFDLEPTDIRNRVTVRHFHQLAEELVERAGLPIADSVDRWSPDWFENDLPSLMMDAVEQLGVRFDAIVVDEGQDFADVWWVALESLFSNPEDRLFSIFYDNNQRLYHRTNAFPVTTPPFPLTRNCRSTRSIQAAAAKYVPDVERMVTSGPEGREIEFVACCEGDELESLGRVLDRLIGKEGIPAETITILTPRSKAKSRLIDGFRAGSVRLAWGDPKPGDVHCATIHAFKGLESDIIILAECDHAYAAMRNPLMYVGLTRAKHHVVVIGKLPPPV